MVKFTIGLELKWIGKALLNYKIAIVGAGPAGYFTAQALQKAQSDNLKFSIDMLEKLPTPGGLVRSGVAPDRQKIKTVSKVFEKIAREDRFRLFANVELGKDISLKELKDQYDAVVIATGAPDSKRLRITGENLANCFSAAQFVSWYNAHPDFKDIKVDFSHETAVIIGTGNVALDIARMLLIDLKDLELTDISEHAIPVFKSSKIQNVIICGRRGPEHASFTPVEIRDISKLSNVNIKIDSDTIDQAINRINYSLSNEKNLKNLELIKTISETHKDNSKKNLELQFLTAPIEIKGENRVEEVVFELNSVENDLISHTGKKFSISTGLVITAIGYETNYFPGMNLINGRISNIAGHIEQNLYVVGWAKRGADGLVGTLKSDAKDVVELLIENLNQPKSSIGIFRTLKPRHKVVDQFSWEKINAAEVVAGEILGKPRVKFTDRKDMLAFVDERDRSRPNFN